MLLIYKSIIAFNQHLKLAKPTQQYCLIISILFFLLTNLFSSCHNKRNSTPSIIDTDSSKAIISKNIYQKIVVAKMLLQDGQLITRSDNDFESAILQNFSRRERDYSHSGIVFKEDSCYVVYHCMGGEENPGETCNREPLDSFINPLKKTAFGIFQYQLSKNETALLHAILKKYVAEKIPFDASFNLNTSDSLYCSEMIWKALRNATAGRIILPSSYINNFRPKIMGYKYNTLFFKKFEFIGIDDLYLNPFCKEIIRVNYN